MRRSLLSLFLSVLLLPAALRAQYLKSTADRPRLVVFITVDQMRADYFDRWLSQFSGGLKRLATGGAFFPNAYHDHAITETAPGHATTMSGRFPWSTGILRNTTGVEDPQSSLVSSRDPGASPYRFRGSTLIDWIRTRDGRARALSVSRKDRGAILPLGRAKQAVFWYASSTGEFTTSHYYADTLPSWLRQMNPRAATYAGRRWTLLREPRDYAEPDSEPIENNGVNFTFPHVLSTHADSVAVELPSTPWMDELTLAVALRGLEAMNLGRGPSTDVLAISLSATDYIGHRYGPDSREQHDNILRLDQSLGVFIDSLYKLRDSSSIVVALTADHGVTPFPELAARRRGRVAPPRYDLRPAIGGLRSALRSHGLEPTAVRFDGPLVSVDRAMFRTAGVDPEPILARFVEAVRGTPGMARVDRVRDLARRDTTTDVVSRRWVHQVPPDSPVELVITPSEGAYSVEATVAEHGQPYDDDTHVPVVFYGPWFRAGRFKDRVLVVDMAPTLARVVGVPPTERVDGRVLTWALASSGAR